MSTVKYFHNQLPGAPVLNNAAGAMIALLDACLVNGFGLKTLDSLVVSGGIATGTVSTGHSFEPDTIAEIAGATPSGLNGQKRILSVSGNSFTFDATGISNQTATGTITAKLAGAGWTKPFTGTNAAAFRSGDPASTRMYLLVNDPSGSNASVRGYENLTDAIGTGQAAFPTAVQVGGNGLFMPKASSVSATAARSWVLVADARTFYLWVATSAGFATGITFMFGDIAPVRSGDSFACVIAGSTVDNTNSTGANTQDVSHSSTTAAAGGMFMPRSFAGIGGSSSVLHRGESYWTTNGFSAGTNNQIAFPNPSDNSLLLNRVVVVELGTSSLRGVQRGLLHTPQQCQAFFDTRSKTDGQGAYAGRKLLFLLGNGAGAGARSAGYFLDITGPWS